MTDELPEDIGRQLEAWAQGEADYADSSRFLDLIRSWMRPAEESADTMVAWLRQRDPFHAEAIATAFKRMFIELAEQFDEFLTTDPPDDEDA